MRTITYITELAALIGLMVASYFGVIFTAAIMGVL